MLILALESSCDETSLSFIKDDQIIGNIISSQIVNHQEYGGVIPELAARLHTQNIDFVYQTLLKQTQVKITDVDAIAYTSEPGLWGCLQVGKIFCETLSNLLHIELLPVNHLYGHVYASNINNQFKFPMLGLVVSGGHTTLFLLKQHLQFELLGQTLDDAAGECLDKIGCILGFDYPAGPLIDQYAQKGNHQYQMPNVKTKNELDFSFSGLKSHCNKLIQKNKIEKQNLNLANFCYDINNSFVNQIIKRLKKYLNTHPDIKAISLGGGVAANTLLRKKMLDLKNKNKNKNLEILIAPKQYCTDNAAMIAKYASVYFLKNKIINKTKGII